MVPSHHHQQHQQQKHKHKHHLDSLLSVARSQLRVAEGRHDVIQEASSAEDVGHLLEQCNDMEGAVIYYQRALNLKSAIVRKKQPTSFHGTVGFLHRKLGEVLRKLQRFSDAEKHTRCFIAEADKYGDVHEKSRAYTQLGLLYSCRAAEVEEHTISSSNSSSNINNNHACEFNSLAIQAHTDALELAKSCRHGSKNELSSTLSVCYTNLGNMFMDSEPQRAAKLFEEALVSSVEPHHILDAQYNLGLTLCLNADTSAAQAAFKRAFSLAIAANVIEVQVECQRMLALLWLSSGDCCAAIEALKVAYVTAKKANDQDEMRLAIRIAKVSHRISALQSMLTDAESINDVHTLLKLHENIGDAMAAVAMLDEVPSVMKNHFFRKGLSAYNEWVHTGTQHGIGATGLISAYSSVAMTCQDLGELLNTVEAYRAALKIAEIDNDTVESNSCAKRLQLAQCLYDLASSLVLLYDDEVDISSHDKNTLRVVEIGELWERARSLLTTDNFSSTSIDQLKLLHLLLSDEERFFKRVHDPQGLAVSAAAAIALLPMHPKNTPATSVDDEQVDDVNSIATEELHMSDIDDQDDNDDSIEAADRRRRRITWTNENGESLLHRAAIRGHVKETTKLLRWGAHFDARDHAGWQPLHECAVHGSVSVAIELLNAGADVDARGMYGITPLMEAASCNQVDVLILLLKNGASVTATDCNGENALDQADNDAIAEILRQYGAKLTEEHNKRKDSSRAIRKKRKAANIMSVDADDNYLNAAEEVEQFQAQLLPATSAYLRRGELPVTSKRCQSQANDISIDKYHLSDSTKGLSNMSSSSGTDDVHRRAKERSGTMNRRSKAGAKTPVVSDDEHDWFEYDEFVVDDSDLIVHGSDNDVHDSSLSDVEESNDNVISRSATKRRRVRSPSPVFVDPRAFHENVPVPIVEDSTLRSNHRYRRLPSASSHTPVSRPSLRDDVTYIPTRSPLPTVASSDNLDEPNGLSIDESEENVDNVLSFYNCVRNSEEKNRRSNAQSGALVSVRFSTVAAAAGLAEHRVIRVYVPLPTILTDTSSVVPNSGAPLPGTCSWLLKAASEHFATIVGARPLRCYLVSSVDGAVLCASDLVTNALKSGESVKLVVESTMPLPLADAYMAECEVAGVGLPVDSVVVAFQNYGHHCPHSLSLCYLGLGNMGSARVVLSSLRHVADSLTSLSLAGNSLGDPEIVALIDGLSSGAAKHSLTSLNLSQNIITSLGVRRLALNFTSLTSSVPKLQHLDLSYNHLTDACSPHIASIIASCPALARLGLENCSITATVFTNDEEIVKALKSSAVQHIGISRNPIDNFGMGDILACLSKACSSLVGLDISFSAAMASSTCDVFHTCMINSPPFRGLRALCLAGCHALQNADQCTFLTSYISKQPSIECLDLYCCGIDAVGCASIATLIGTSRLSSLRLRGNPIRDSGLEVLAKAIRTAKSFYSLDVSYCSATIVGVLAVLHSAFDVVPETNVCGGVTTIELCTRPSLKQLALGYNTEIYIDSDFLTAIRKVRDSDRAFCLDLLDLRGTLVTDPKVLVDLKRVWGQLQSGGVMITHRDGASGVSLISAHLFSEHRDTGGWTTAIADEVFGCKFGPICYE